MANPKNAAWYGVGLAIALDTSVGNIYYVSEGGADTNDGLTPATPKLTINGANGALSLTTAGQDDYVIVLDYNISHTGEVWPIDMNKSDVHLIGTMHSAHRAPSHFVVNTAGNTILINADRIEIAGLSLGADGTTGCCVYQAGYRAQFHLHHCDLGHNTTCQDGVRIVDNQSWNWEIDNCRFGHDTAGIVRDGIRHTAHQQGRIHIHDNIFYVRSPGVGIRLGLGTGGIVERNTFKVPDAANGEAITAGDPSAGGVPICTFNNNWAGASATAMTFNPYRDTGTANAWGLNFAGIAAVLPVTV